MNRTSIAWVRNPDGTPGFRTPKDAKREYDHARYLTRRTRLLERRQPDPVTLLSKEELAYIAGIVDGEGSIFVTKNPKTMYPIVTVAMTHKGVIEWICDKLKTPSLWINNQTGLRRGTNWKPQWRVQIQGRRAKILVAYLRPYLKVKAQHAELLSDYPVDARIGPGKKVGASEINAVRESIRLQIKKLNRRGIASIEEAE